LFDTFGYGYDAANNVTSFSSIDGTATYGYDPTNQLTSATYTTASGGHQPANESYSFDKNGNRNMTGYSTGSDNLMSSDGTYNYQYDADGNTTVRTQIASTYSTQYKTTYNWDYRNRLTDVEYYDDNSVLTEHVHYIYDVFDHLLATEADTTGSGTYNQVAWYALDVSPEVPQAGVPGTLLAPPVFVFSGSQTLTQRNLVALDPAGVDQVMIQEAVPSLTQGGVNTYMADDNLGTPRDEVSSTGVLLNHSVFAAFGQDVYDTNSSVAHWTGFAGGHEDPNTNLVDDGNRWYNPATGHWESQDPDGFTAGDSDLQRYVGNNPTNAIDPLGLEPAPGPTPQQITPTPNDGQIVQEGKWYMNNANNWVNVMDNFRTVITLCPSTKHAHGYIIQGNGTVVGQFVAQYGQTPFQPIFLPTPKNAPKESPFKVQQNAKGEWEVEMSKEVAQLMNGLALEAAVAKQITEKQAFTMKGEAALFLNITVNIGNQEKKKQKEARDEMLKYEAMLGAWVNAGFPAPPQPAKK